MSNRSLRRAGVVGASGLVGRALLMQLLAAGHEPVHAFVRKAPAASDVDARVATHVIDFERPPLELPPLDDLYCALGTTIKAAGSEAAFRRVDLDHVVAAARAAQRAGATRLAVVSALGADAGSRVFYNRVKGEMEAAVTALGFGSVVIARPSLLAGDRGALGQPSRPGERMALALTAPLRALLPRGVRPIEAGVVARALVRSLAAAPPGVTVLDSGRLQTEGA